MKPPRDLGEVAVGSGPSVSATLLLLLAAAIPVGAPAEEPAPEEPAPGKFLIASRDLQDPNFARTVILLVDYDRNGAMGVVINRPTSTKLSALLPEIEELDSREDKVWLGGPVSRWQMTLLARSDQSLEGSRNVLEDVYFSASRLVLQDLLATNAEFRVYSGYAGWSPGQLDHEIARGGWHVLPGEAEMVFDEAPSELWGELIVRSTVQWAGRSLLSPTRGERGWVK